MTRPRASVVSSPSRGRSSAGRAPPCQGGCRRFESDRPLQLTTPRRVDPAGRRRFRVEAFPWPRARSHAGPAKIPVKTGRVVLLLLVAAGRAASQWHGRNEFGDGSGDAVERRDAEHVAPPLAGDEATATRRAHGSGSDARRRRTGGSDRCPSRRRGADRGTGRGVASAETAVEPVATYAGEMPTGWHEAPPAQRPHAIRPPRPRGPSVGPGGSSGGVGPTGHWSRFPPAGPAAGRRDAPRRGRRTSTGAPVPGADVYLGPPREPAGGGRLLRRPAEARRHGRARRADWHPIYPPGAAVLAANVANQLNGPRGLDARSSIPVLLVSRATVAARVQLPLDTGAFGTVSGRVVDEKERPIARAEIRCGFFRTYADAEGRFEAPHLPAGEQSLSARRNGYASGTVDGGRPARRDARGRDRPGLGRERGAAPRRPRAHGRRRGARRRDGLPDRRDADAGRSAPSRSGAEGEYVFEDLPERLRTTARPRPGRTSSGRATPPRTSAWRRGLTDARSTSACRRARCGCRFWLRDAGTGDPIDRCRIEVERLDDPEASPRGFTGSRPDGVFEHFYPAGRYRFAVEAPDRETQVVEADLAPPGGDVDLAVAVPLDRRARRVGHACA